MGKIVRLPPEIIARTAAGEVIERPASVVKELIDNALDAQATNIKVEVENAGISKIRVTDNGIGMDATDIKLSIEPHTTSKVLALEDLEAIKTLGFRGEALSSIAAVSTLSIKSKTIDALVGTEVQVQKGVVINEKPVGMRTGTDVTVANIFYNTPARKHSLTSTKTELVHISDVVTANALANPQVGFSLIHNKKPVLELPNFQTAEDRVRAVLGKQVFANLLPISENTVHYKLWGFISKPQVTYKSKTKQFVFINNRYVKTCELTSYIEHTYQTLLSNGEHPVIVLFVEAPFGMVDVNVHPRKEEVRFVNKSAITELVAKTVAKTLNQYDLMYTTDFSGNPAFSTYTYQTLKDSVELWDVFDYDEDDIIQIANTYLVTPAKDGIILVDQHAAHEKILYEQLVESLTSKVHNAKVQLTTPELVELTSTDSTLIQEHLDLLTQLGFDIDMFGTNIVRISAVPTFLQDQELPSVLESFLADVRSGTKHTTINDHSLAAVSYLACRSAIKAGVKLTKTERKRLIKKLAQTKTRYTCPHGRPSIIKVQLGDLEKMFRRK